MWSGRKGSLHHLHPYGVQVPLPKVVSYTKQIAEALQYAHDHIPSIVHHDIKPENMLVRQLDDIALGDFGIAVTGRSTGNLQLQIREILEKVSRREEIAIPGTAYYIAPERLQGHTQRASDQYSLAVVVYEWLSGHCPFTGRDDLEICQQHFNTPPPPLRDVLPSIPKAVEEVVMKGLEKSPGDRFARVELFARALEDAFLQSAQTTWEEVDHSPALLDQRRQSGNNIETASSPVPTLSTSLFPVSLLSETTLKDFFISHCEEDKGWASWIAWQLEEVDYFVILPEWDFPQGSNLEQQMREAATKARCTIALLSPRACPGRLPEPMERLVRERRAHDDKIQEKRGVKGVYPIRKGWDANGTVSF